MSLSNKTKLFYFVSFFLFVLIFITSAFLLLDSLNQTFASADVPSDYVPHDSGTSVILPTLNPYFSFYGTRYTVDSDFEYAYFIYSQSTGTSFAEINFDDITVDGYYKVYFSALGSAWVDIWVPFPTSSDSSGTVSSSPFTTQVYMYRSSYTSPSSAGGNPVINSTSPRAENYNATVTGTFRYTNLVAHTLNPQIRYYSITERIYSETYDVSDGPNYLYHYSLTYSLELFSADNDSYLGTFDIILDFSLVPAVFIDPLFMYINYSSGYSSFYTASLDVDVSDFHSFTNAFYGTSYQSGYDTGYKDGYGNGLDYANSNVNQNSASYGAGYSAGVESANSYSFTSLISAVFDVPLRVFVSLFDFDILGFNMLTFVSSVLALSAFIAVIRRIL